MSDAPNLSNITLNSPNPQPKAPIKKGTTQGQVKIAQPGEKTLSIPAIQDYDVSSGAHTPRPNSFGNEPVQERPAKEKVADPAATADRHAEWKKAQADKKKAKEESKQAKALQNQELAATALKAGDLVKAAQLLGMSPSDLLQFTQNGALGIKPEPAKELSAAEKRQQDEDKFRADRLAFEKEQKEFRDNLVRHNYITKNIDPVIADKEKYEFIHQGDVESWKAYAYDFMDKHFVETGGFQDGKKVGQELSAADVLDQIETTLSENYTKSLEKAKQVKKLAKYFAPEPTNLNEEEEEEDLGEDDLNAEPRYKVSTKSERYSPGNDPNSLTSKLLRKKPFEEPAEEVEEEEETAAAHEKFQARRTDKKTVPFAFWSKAEKLAHLRQQQK